MRAKPREIRQARAYFFNRQAVVSRRYCVVFVSTAKIMRMSFSQLDRLMQDQIAAELGAFREAVHAQRA